MRRSDWPRALAVGCAASASLLAAPLAVAHLAPPAATAPATPANTVSGVTVTPAPKPNPLVDPQSQFVRSHLPLSTLSDQYPRFRDPVCVKVLGLPAEFDAFVSRRIVELANEVHAPVAKHANCLPNVHVVFTAQPQALLTDIAKRRDVLLGFYFETAQLRGLSTITRPIEARYVTRSRDTTGESFLEIHNPSKWRDRPAGRAGSRLGDDMSTEVVHSLILADAIKVADAKIGAVADYIAVLALAKWQGLERCNAIPTILNLMADGCDRDSAPEAVTEADIGLLKGLYSVDPREIGSQQRATIASAMERAAKAPDAGSR
jgi:hypothetical protein